MRNNIYRFTFARAKFGRNCSGPSELWSLIKESVLYVCRDATGKDQFLYGLLVTVVDTRIAATATVIRIVFLRCPYRALRKEGK